MTVLESSGRRIHANKVWVQDAKEGFIEGEVIEDPSANPDEESIRVKLPTGNVSPLAIIFYLEFKCNFLQ